MYENFLRNENWMLIVHVKIQCTNDANNKIFFLSQCHCRIFLTDKELRNCPGSVMMGWSPIKLHVPPVRRAKGLPTSAFLRLQRRWLTAGVSFIWRTGGSLSPSAVALASQATSTSSSGCFNVGLLRISMPFAGRLMKLTTC